LHSQDELEELFEKHRVLVKDDTEFRSLATYKCFLPQDSKKYISEIRFNKQSGIKQVTGGICINKIFYHFVATKYFNCGDFKLFAKAIKNGTIEITNSEITELKESLLKDLKDLYRKGICHKDLHAKNILVHQSREDGKYQARLCDGGIIQEGEHSLGYREDCNYILQNNIFSLLKKK
jgi:serine/threonine protein kinase